MQIRDLIAYLTGETNFCASIKAVALPAPTQVTPSNIII